MDNDTLVIISGFITALATLALVAVTYVLAKYTKRLTESSASPQVVVILTRSRWSIMHVDLEVENTGNATAFDVVSEFDPPLIVDKSGQEETPAPFSRISVLKPGQNLQSFLGDYVNYKDTKYQVKTSWSRMPGGKKRESISYNVDISHLEFSSTLGGGFGDPAIAVASELEKMRKGILPFFKGSKRGEINVHSHEDRERQAEASRRSYERQKKMREARNAEKKN